MKTFFSRAGLFGCLVLAPLVFPILGFSAALDPAIQAIRAVGPEGQGNAQATQAWNQLIQSNADALPRLLAGMDGANDLAVNWLRSAVETIAERELKAGRPLPLAALNAYLVDTRHNPRARRMTFEMIQRVKPEAAALLIPGMLNDPSLELRYDAVQQLITRADAFAASKDGASASLVYRQALGFARNVNQIQHINDNLKKLGETVDLPSLLGFLTTWKVIGPFHNIDMAGFAEVFPPEKGIDFKAEYEGKHGPVRWTNAVTADPYGMLDINKYCGATKEVTGYAYTEFQSPVSRTAELRLGSKNGWKVWFNGQFLFGRDEYHRNIEIDQYIMPVTLKAGKNTLLVKVCQNKQVEDWTKEWEFQIRVCDSIGTAIAVQTAAVAPATNLRIVTE